MAMLGQRLISVHGKTVVYWEIEPSGHNYRLFEAWVATVKYPFAVSAAGQMVESADFTFATAHPDVSKAIIKRDFGG